MPKRRNSTADALELRLSCIKPSIWPLSRFPIQIYSPQPMVRPPLHFVSGCFGNIIHFQCGEGERIRIVDDLYGRGDPDRCSHALGDCVVHPNGQASIVKQLCNTKERCRSLIVTRLFCGDHVTSYQQITYECVPGKGFYSVIWCF